MNQVWGFKRGTWSPVTSPIPLVDSDGEQIAELEGYREETLWLGLEGGFQVEVYTREENKRASLAPFLAILYMGGENREYVFVDDLPSLIQFLNTLAPIIQCSNEDIEAHREMGDDEDLWEDEEEEERGDGDRFR